MSYVPESADITIYRKEIQLIHGLITGNKCSICMYELDLEDPYLLNASILSKEEIEDLIQTRKEDNIILEGLLKRIYGDDYEQPED